MSEGKKYAHAGSKDKLLGLQPVLLHAEVAAAHYQVAKFAFNTFAHIYLLACFIALRWLVFVYVSHRRSGYL